MDAPIFGERRAGGRKDSIISHFKRFSIAYICFEKYVFFSLKKNYDFSFTEQFKKQYANR